MPLMRHMLQGRMIAVGNDPVGHLGGGNTLRKNPQAAADGPSMAKAAAACGVLLLAESPPRCGSKKDSVASPSL